MLSKSLSTSERRARLQLVAGPLAEFAQSLFPLLVAHADDYGRLQGDPFTVKHGIDPSSPRSTEDFVDALRALHAVGMIVWYEVSGRRFIEITKFIDHQGGMRRRVRSAFPDPIVQKEIKTEDVAVERTGTTGDAYEPRPACDTRRGPPAGDAPEAETEGVDRSPKGHQPEPVEQSASPPDNLPALSSAEDVAAELKGTERNRTERKGTEHGARARPLPTLIGLIPRRKGYAAFEGPGGLYVPQSLHEQFVALKHNHIDPERELFAWYEEVSEAWTHGAHADDQADPDMYRFWRAQHRERWPPTPSTASGGSVEAHNKAWLIRREEEDQDS